ncbi:universal stress protein [Nocardioides plantarum]|uniref:Universal stress protein n=1 Tax=Nocardioides plantarum TaxID=29299 RepID=A0ABV5K7I5_9ACTN|nr:universal stress protein [Nocardioides plantarum]
MRIIEAPHGTVVVGIDGSTASTRAADWAADLAQRDGRALTLAHSSDPFTFEEGGVWSGWGDWHELQRRSRAEYGVALTTAVDRVTERYPGVVVHVVEDYIDPRLALTQLSEHAHLLVVGSHGRGPLASALLGSVSAAVARTAHCPTAVLRQHPSGSDRVGVVVVIDREHPSTAAVELAFRHASTTQRPLRAVLCHDEHEHPRQHPDAAQLRLELSELCAGLGEKFPDVRVTHEVERGPLADVLVGATVTSDVVFMDRGPHRPLDRLARSGLATTVLEHARGPVVVVPERRS